MAKEFKPTTTQYPNFLFEIMPSLKEGELRLLNAIVRKTYGYGKSEDRISLSQMIKLTGLSKQGILDAREGLLTKKIIATKMVNGITEYVVLVPDDAPVYEVDVQNLDGNQVDVKIKQKASQNQTDQPVKILDTQKKELQNKITKENNIENEPKYILEEQPHKKIQKVIDRFLKENGRGKCREDGYNLSEIVKLCVSENIEEEVYDMCVRFKNHPWWWDNYSPQPKRLCQAWDQLLAIEIPEWKRLGYGSEYAYNLDKRKSSTPQQPPIEPEEPQQVATVKPEDIDNFMNAMDELKT